MVRSEGAPLFRMKTVVSDTNSVDPDQMQKNTASDQVLYGLAHN